MGQKGIKATGTLPLSDIAALSEGESKNQSEKNQLKMTSKSMNNKITLSLLRV